jgi:ribosome-binding factor A
MARIDKITEALRKEISVIVHDDLKDPRLGFVTVTKVEVTQDYREAKVYFSVLGSEEDHKKTAEALNSASGFIRREIAHRINLRFTPEIMFREDRSSEYSVRIEEVLNEIKETVVTEVKKKPVAKKTKKRGELEHKENSRSRKKVQ